MLDYIFFDTTLTNKFKLYLSSLDIDFQTEIEHSFGSVQGEIVSISDDTDEKILSDLQSMYDNLQDELEQILEATDEGLIMNAAGMQVVLNDGKICTLRVSPDVITRILTVLEFDELQEFIDNIAKSVQDPDSGHFCKNK